MIDIIQYIRVCFVSTPQFDTKLVKFAFNEFIACDDETADQIAVYLFVNGIGYNLILDSADEAKYRLFGYSKKQKSAALNYMQLCELAIRSLPELEQRTIACKWFRFAIKCMMKQCYKEKQMFIPFLFILLKIGIEQDDIAEYEIDAYAFQMIDLNLEYLLCESIIYILQLKTYRTDQFPTIDFIGDLVDEIIIKEMIFAMH